MKRLSYLNLALALFTFALLYSPPVFAADGDKVVLSTETISDGDMQSITLERGSAQRTADVYLLLTGPGGLLRSLKADNTFTAPGRIAPRLSGAKLGPSTELANLRLTGLAPGAYKWMVFLVEPGTGLDGKAKAIAAAFEVKKSDGPLFAELAEGRDGGPRGAAAKAEGARSSRSRRALSSGGGAAGSDSPASAPSAAPAESFFSAPPTLTAPLSASPAPPGAPMPAREPADPFGGADTSAPRSASGPASKRTTVAKPKALAKKSAAVKDLEVADGAILAPDPEMVLESLADIAPAKGGVLGGDFDGDAIRGKAADRLLDGAERKKAAGEIQKAKSLTAGATDDNKDFGDFLTFLKDRNSAAVMCQDIAQRRFITVLDSKGRHVSNADVAIRKGDDLLFAGRTLANGQTLFCPATVPELKAGKHTLDIEVAKGLVSRSWSVQLDVDTDDKLVNKFDPKQMPEQAMPIDIMPLPGCGCGVGLKPMARKARAAAAPAALRALEAAPVAISADALSALGDDFAAAYKAATPHTGGTLDAIPGLAPERERTVPKGDWVLRLPGKLPVEAPKIDLVFQIDTTGSMRDEIRAVQATLQSVAKRIDSMDPKPTVRWGLVLYGDRGDTYVVRRYSFTPDVNELHDWVLNMAMTGGGDTPESALEALHASVNEMAWDSGDAIRLVFLIADAPPHLDYSRPYTYVDKMKEAVAKGIKIIPTAASGLNKTGEYIFRQWAQGTMGKFLYITYGAGGAGGKAGTTDHEVAQPKKKNNLDDLIVQAVADELANWRSPKLYDSGDKKIEKPKLAVAK